MSHAADRVPSPGAAPPPVIRTARLALRRLSLADAEFILELVNDPDWLRNIGDRGVRTLEDARGYLLRGPMAMYEQLGYGLWRVELRDDGEPIGICGLVRRDALPDVDVGFAFLPRFRARGYAYEAAAATVEYAERALGLSRVVAVVSPGNDASIRLLEKLGMRRERAVRLGPGADEVLLYAPAGPAAAGRTTT
ncbi:MAG TPA: GNAT family N-acetyltransferase [Longimicrobiaceae bacterium]|nr:GNAT family N-acetyltransferase [Longimicrobiaceae bacterium]